MNSFADTIDVNPGDGLALDANGESTLRAAVMESNALAGDDSIVLPAGIFELTLLGTGSGDAATGSLSVTDVTGSLTVVGAGEAMTTVKGGIGWDDSILSVLADAELSIEGLTITEGTRNGLTNNFGALTVRNSTVTGNSGSAGGISTRAGILRVINSTISHNVGSTFSGGIQSSGNGFNAKSHVDIIGSFIQDNDGAALRGGWTIWSIDNTTITRNLRGSAVVIATNDEGQISNSSVSDNLGRGPAINCGGDLIITDTLVLNNAGGQTGGISNNRGTMVIERSTISGHTGEFTGGIANFGDLTIIDSEISNNHSTVIVQGGAAGGVANNRGNLTIVGSVIRDNSAASFGGALISRERSGTPSSLTVIDSLITHNESPRHVIQLEGGTANFVRTMIADNVGVAIQSRSTVLAVSESTISGNRGTVLSSRGGAISAVGNDTVTIDNSTISGNIAATGAGINLGPNAVATVNNSTITENHMFASSPNGGGIQTFSSIPVTIRNTIVAGNTPFDLNTSGVFNSLGYNLIGDVGGGIGFTDGVINDQVGGAGNPLIDPLLGTLQDNGGPTPTHALLANSPAVDAASSTDSNGDPVVLDQRGIARPQGSAHDIGSFEVEVTNSPPEANAGGPYTINEGSGIILDASASLDVDANIATYSWDLDNDGQYDDASGVSPVLPGSDLIALGIGDDGTYSISLLVEDDLGEYGTASSTITVNNVAPFIDSVSAPGFANKGVEGSEIEVSGSFSDVGTLDTHTATVDWGDGSAPEVVSLTQGSGSGTFLGTHTYADGGVYTVNVTLADDDGDTDTITTTAVIAGVGLDADGTLEIIGTNGADQVTVNRQGNGIIKVHADFLPSGNFKTFDADDVDRIMAFLCDGDDHMNVSGNIDLPVLIDGGAGDDHLNGGGARDILIGGLGADRLVGGKGEDVLIGGEVDEDQASLQVALTAWDTADSYTDRVTAIDGLLSVTDDADPDKLTGSSNQDLFYDGVGDDLTDVKTKGKSPETVL